MTVKITSVHLLSFYKWITATIYIIFTIICLSWLSISAKAYYSVLNTFGFIPGNDPLAEMAKKRNYEVPVISAKYDELILDAFLWGLVLVPIWFFITYLISLASKNLSFNRLLASIALALFILTFLLLQTDVFGWYFEYIVD